MRPRSASFAALAVLSIPLLPLESRAYPTVEGQAARYVIITGDALAAEFQPLADWKTQAGLPAVVRRMSDVIAAHPAAFDDAERVRLEIRDAWQAGAQWVLLGGGVGLVPHRYARTAFFGGKDLLTDLYFQCLDGDWDADGDHVYGEPADNADLAAEVWLGRAPVLTVEEARRFVAKTLQYTRTPAGDYEHMSLECAEVLSPEGWTPGDPTTLDGAELVEPLLPFFDLHPSLQVARLYENFSDARWRPGALPETPGTVLDALDAGSNQTLIVGNGYIHSVSVGTGALGESDFLGLDNRDRLATLRFLGCVAAQFDSGGIASAALLAPRGGAVSVVGGSDFEFPTAARIPLTEYYRVTYQDGVNAQGEAMARSLLSILPFAGFDGVIRWTVMTQVLLGDPELRTWTAPLRELAVQHRRVVRVGDAELEVAVSAGSEPVGGAQVACWLRGQFLSVAITDAGGLASVPIQPTGRGHILLTVTARDARPYEARVQVAGPVPRFPAGSGDRDRLAAVERPDDPGTLEATGPARLALRVRGPLRAALAPEIELVLGSSSPARLEVMDLAGRRAASRDLAGLGPGTHTVRLDGDAALAPGLYWFRITQDGHSASARAVLLR